MGVDLIGHGGESCNTVGWRTILDLAVAFGWQPRGTAPPENWDGEWAGGYFSNDGQLVTEPDARALSDALYRATAAIKARADLNDEQTEAVHAWCDEDLCRIARYFARGSFIIL